MLNTLNVSHTGLSSAKRAVENVSNNIANENTPGYKKRVVDLKELEQTDTRFTGRGVGASDAYRVTNEYMLNRIIDEGTREQSFTKLSSILNSVETTFRETDNSGFSKDLNRYFQSVENLRANPNSEVYKNNLENEGRLLVNSIQNLYDGIEEVQKKEKLELKSNVEEVNDILNEIGQINEKLGGQREATNDLLDRRDKLEEDLSQYFDIKVDRTPDEYSLEIAGQTAVRYNTNIRDINVNEEHTPQTDRFVDATGKNSNIGFADGINSGDKITFKLNNTQEVTVEIGSDQYIDSNGNSHDIDIDGDGTADTINSSNYVRALKYAINDNPETKSTITAYNGNYQVQSNGTKSDSINDGSDAFLLVESDSPGENGKFEGRITVTENIGGVETRNGFYKNEQQSNDAASKVSISIYEQEVDLNSGVLKVQTDNLSSDSPNNKLQVYKDKLDQFVSTLTDVTDKYIRTGVDDYTFGEKAIDESAGGTVEKLGLFSGTSVNTLKFNESAINDLDQKDLDYLAELQWKKDLSFKQGAQDPNDNDRTSFSEYFQEIRAIVSEDKESSDFILDTQKDIKMALESSYNEVTKVDKDEEMMNLIKFQSAYTANAKIVTAIDEMLQTLLGLKR
ncbi:MAG: FlgK family flagellar hook-associated protein [Campylobacterota bacterium]